MRAGASTPTRHMCVWFFFPFFILCLHPQMPLPPVCACNRPTLSIRLGSHVNDLDTSPPAACLQRGQQRVPGQVRAGVPQTATVWVLWFARTRMGGWGLSHIDVLLYHLCERFVRPARWMLDAGSASSLGPAGRGWSPVPWAQHQQSAFQNSESEDGKVPLSQHAWGVPSMHGSQHPPPDQPSDD